MLSKGQDLPCVFSIDRKAKEFVVVTADYYANNVLKEIPEFRGVPQLLTDLVSDSLEGDQPNVCDNNKPVRLYAKTKQL